MEAAKRQERRKGSDPITKSISIFSGATWILALIVLIIISNAQPKTPTLFSRNAITTLTPPWNKELLGYVAVILAFTAVVCFTGLAVNSIRHRRRSDYYNRSLLVFGVGSIIGIISYFIFA